MGRLIETNKLQLEANDIEGILSPLLLILPSKNTSSLTEVEIYK